MAAQTFDAAQTRQAFQDVADLTRDAYVHITLIDRGVMAPVGSDGNDERFQEPMPQEVKDKHARLASQAIADARDRLARLLEGRRDVVVEVPATPIELPIEPAPVAEATL